MNIFRKSKIIDFHKARIFDGAPDFKKLGWRCVDSQIKRFETLLNIGELSDKILLDLGCGYGDFKFYINGKFTNMKYIGIDIMPEFIHEAEKRFKEDPDTSFVLGDFSKMNLPKVDFVVASGALCYKNLNKYYYRKMIKKMFCSAKIAIAFNMLDENIFPKHTKLQAHNKLQIKKYCENLSDKIFVYDGYLEDDFTIIVWK